MSITTTAAGELHAQLKSGELTSTECTQAFLDAIKSNDKLIEAFLHVDESEALRQASEIDSKRESGQPIGLLEGMPVAVKDVLCTRGQPTTCASKILNNFVPPYDAHSISLLRKSGAVLIGKTNMDEFAMGSSCENSAYQTTKNPWNTEHASGGSSGGSAAAVSAGLSPIAVGSDTGGSVRQPASFCGVVGMKPTYGRISRFGLIAYASSLDQVGPFANDVEGTALLLEAIAGHDSRDSTSVDVAVPAYSQTVNEPLSGLRIGLAREHFAEGLNSEVETAVREAIKVYESLGATVVDVSLPHSKYAVATYYLIAPSEASSNLSRFDGVHYGHRAEQFDNLVDMYSTTRGEGIGSEVKRRIMLGAYALSAGYYDAYYLKALKVRRLIRNDFDEAFKTVDVIAGPVSPAPAFKIGELSNDPLAMYLSDIYTVPANLAGIPGISIPAGMSGSGLPIGLQLLAAPFEEEKLLRTARMFERETHWSDMRPAMN